MSTHITILNIGGCCKHPLAARLAYQLGMVKPKKEKNVMLELTLTNEQQQPISLKPVTSTGKPAKLDGAPTWSVVTGNSQVVPSDDGLSALIVSSDDPGDTDILVKADADLGEGIIEISDIIRVHVQGAQAANLGLTAGTPEPKP